MTKTPSPRRKRGHPGGATSNETPFAKWLAAMGLNKKQVAAGGMLIGLSRVQSVACNTGARDLSEAERLAMAALRAGVPPWSPEIDEDLGRVKGMLELADVPSRFRAAASKASARRKSS